MNDNHYPILEFDDRSEAVLEPHKVLHRRDDMPQRVVMCFFQDAIRSICEQAQAVHLLNLGSEIGPNPVYVLEQNGQRIALTHAGLGGPLSGAFLEELIALGGRQFMACGGAGVLDSQFPVGHVVLPAAAIRDEGLSYHYLPPAREVTMRPEAIQAMERVLKRHGVPYDIGKTWTTDAIYRETRDKVARRRAEGCLTVEMETASFLAVAAFRDVVFGQMLYGGDDVSGAVWDSRDWHKRAGVREKLLWLALEAVLELG